MTARLVEEAGVVSHDDSTRPRVGILALQGAVREHARALALLGADPVEIRQRQDLEGVDALVLPGGESTTMSRLLETSGLLDDLGHWLTEGLPILATCAGLILLARTVRGGRPDQRSFAVLDIEVVRNGYGRQVDSFEADVDIAALGGGPFRGVFIRAPVITSIGSRVEVLASVDGHAVLVRQGRTLGSTFHPELSGDLRLHQLFLEGR